jgi:hypothetical protein
VDTPKLDIVLLVDLSGSYRNDLPNIKALAPGLFDAIRADVPDSQFGLTTFRDFPFAPWGASNDYAYSLAQDLTTSKSTWLTAINGMSASGGYDSPEAQYEGIFQAVSGLGREMPITADGDYSDHGEVAAGLNVSFRPDATKVIAITTDAAFHQGGDPCAYTGGSYPATYCSFDYPGATESETIAALNDAGVKIIAIKAPGATSQMDRLATATGGASVTTSSTSAQIASAVLVGLEALTYTVTASPGGECDPLDFSYVPDSFTDVSGGDSVTFVETIAVPTDITAGDLDEDGYLDCSVEFLADDTLIGTQDVSIYVPLNAPPVALCADLDLSADGTCSADGDVDDGSYDPDGDAITYDYSVEGPYAVGSTEVVLTVTDPSGESDSCTATVTVSDVTAPTVTVGAATDLWPPNHKYADFDLSDCGVTITDSCAGDLDVNAVGVISSIYSDEVEEASGNGDGKTYDDIVIDSDTEFALRAERAGGSNGRVYGITFDVDDGAGNVTEATCTVGVPHSQNGTAAIDDGPGAGYTVN